VPFRLPVLAVVCCGFVGVCGWLWVCLGGGGGGGGGVARDGMLKGKVPMRVCMQMGVRVHACAKCVCV